MLSLLALAIAPGAAITFYIYSQDKYDREPLKPLLISFVLGMIMPQRRPFFRVKLSHLLFLQFPGFNVWYYFLLGIYCCGWL